MAHADLVRVGAGQHLGRPEVRAPDLRLDPIQEGLDHVATAARGDHVVAGLGRLERPLPLGPPGHPGAGLIRVDDRTATDRLPDRRVRRPRPFDQPRQRVLDAALADREPEHVPTHFDQPLVPDVVALVQVAQQRLDPGPERPPRLQPDRIGAPSSATPQCAQVMAYCQPSITTGATGGSSTT